MIVRIKKSSWKTQKLLCAGGLSQQQKTPAVAEREEVSPVRPAVNLTNYRSKQTAKYTQLNNTGNRRS